MIQSSQSCEISYQQFKRTMDTIIYGQKITQEDYYVVELLLNLSLAVDSYVLPSIQRLVDALLASSTPSGRAKFGTTEDYTKSGTTRQLIKKLHKLVVNHSNDLAEISSINNPKYADIIVETVDYVDSNLSLISEALEHTLRRKLSIKTLSTPADVNIFTMFMLAIMYSELTMRIHADILESFPILKEERLRRIYKPLSFEDIWTQIKKIIHNIEFKSSRGGILRYNMQGLKESKEVRDIYDDFAHIVYSTEFINGIFAIRTGVKDFISHSTAKSFADNFESITMPLAWYNEKYSKIINS